MRTRLIVLAILVAVLFLDTKAPAQERKILSPRDSVFLSLDTNVVSVNYGRPSMRSRKIMGDLVPWNKVWRTGANQATHFKTNFDMVLGGVPVTRGTYTLWSLPSPGGWKLIINKQTGQWGTNYDERQDLARFEAVVKQISTPVETLTVSLEATGKSSGVMTLSWENTSVSAPFEKNTHIRPLSPPDSASASIEGKKLFVKYSKPYARGRAVWGVVVPWDSVWRTGANLSTTFVTDADLMAGDLKIPKGSYTLFSIPSQKGLALILSSRPGGTPPQYDPALDRARIPMTLQQGSENIDPFRIWFEQQDARSVLLKLGWADRTYAVKLTTGH
jgi:hypothetical protein